MTPTTAGALANWKDLKTTLPGLIGGACLLVAGVPGHLGAPDWLVQICSWVGSGGLAMLGICASSVTVQTTPAKEPADGTAS